MDFPSEKECGMDDAKLRQVFSVGETIAVEFKRGGNGVEADTYESVCSFLNRFGGDLFLGVLDDGTVVGVPEKAASSMVKNFVKVISNPKLMEPTVYLAPEILKYDGHTIIHVHVAPSGEVHKFKNVIYDRVDDADVKVTSTSAIAEMYIRKQNIFTEKRIYKFVDNGDLRTDVLAKCRRRAVNRIPNHPWKDLSDEELLKSAGLYGENRATGEKGYNLAGILLLGKDEVIRDICPAYRTDALLRRVNLDRYDDRELVRTNLIESFDRLMEFVAKNLPDKFSLEGTVSVSLRDRIAREMISNILIHREYSSSYIAKLIIEKNRLYSENACRASMTGEITPENLNPDPKNPLIASFFHEIGNADELGSGTRNLFKYTRLYSGAEPVLREGDIFIISIPLKPAFSMENDLSSETVNETVNTNETAALIYLEIKKHPSGTYSELSGNTGFSRAKIARLIKELKEKGVIERVGSDKQGMWKINKFFGDI